MLASAYCHQLRQLISSLNSDNYTTHIEELNNIAMSLGESSKVVLITSLLDEINFRDGNVKDVQKVNGILVGNNMLC